MDCSISREMCHLYKNVGVRERGRERTDYCIMQQIWYNIRIYHALYNRLHFLPVISTLTMHYFTIHNLRGALWHLVNARDYCYIIEKHVCVCVYACIVNCTILVSIYHPIYVTFLWIVDSITIVSGMELLYRALLYIIACLHHINRWISGRICEWVFTFIIYMLLIIFHALTDAARNVLCLTPFVAITFLL